MNHKLILSDADKDIYSVSVTVCRMEQVNSGSMQFTHPRYLTFGQLVVFTDKEVTDDQCGALFFKRGEEAVLDNIIDHIEHEKEKPDNSNIIEE